MGATLCQQQRDQLGRLLRAASPKGARFPALALTGGPGTGKRTLAIAAAETLGMDFITIDMRNSAEAIVDTLFGSRQECERASIDGLAPGDLGRSGRTTLLYLAALQSLPTTLFPRFAELLDRHTFTDQTGNRWPVSEEVFIVAGITIPSEHPTLSPDHWLCAKFLRFQVHAPVTAEDFFCIAKNMLLELRPLLSLEVDVQNTLKHLHGVPEPLHVLRQWVVDAHGHASGSSIGRAILEKAMLSGLQWHCSECEYRGGLLDPNLLKKWILQFPEEARPTAIVVFCRIAERYFIGRKRYFGAIQKVIEQSSLSKRASIIFCTWQHLGKSSPSIANQIKNQAGWRTTRDLDLQTTGDWADLDKQLQHQFVIADDFVGTGKTLAGLFSDKKGAPAIRLLEHFPNARLTILVLAGFDAGMRRIDGVVAAFRDRVQLHWAIQFSDADRCFTPESTILSGESQRLFQESCLKIAKEQFRTLPPRFALGFDEFGALVVFQDTVPNNSLPIIWHGENWIPIFPGSGLSEVG